ncbi:NADH:flavin oxidoreductase/NADH oxidase [Desulfovibrio sp. X2]|uniref:NADH:flavin oxidoreductase n=1 Tax=Desulfovibrio sp. X2 TaxID=941449 RepID=UPI000358ECF6|nr:NADH:flavin oxidoreductase [Desulfovibrio sp. X2]EPR44287.1 NADH:flavin oxidoreductase/NADH oxidase [Desulfovibrio sp. X2]
MKTLFDPIRIGGIALRNRLVRSATWERMADEAGRPTDRLVEVYEELADGGVGMIITSATHVTPVAGVLPGILGLYDDALIEGHARLAAAAHARGCPIVLQATFAGRNGERWNALTPSRAEIAELVEAYGDAARRAKLAGYDGVQIHSAHGFFLSGFLNPAVNVRTDEYGGSPENRTRMLLSIFRAMRRAVGDDFPVLVKIDSTNFDGPAEGKDAVFEGCLHACEALAAEGLAAVEVSGMGGAMLQTPKLPYEESVFRDQAAQIAARITGKFGVPVGMVGLNKTPAVMRGVLEKTDVAFFSLARALLREPALPAEWAAGRDSPAECISCNACYQDSGNACVFR